MDEFKLGIDVLVCNLGDVDNFFGVTFIGLVG